MTTARRALAGLGAFAVLALLLVGVPLALIVVVGWPLPHSWPTADQVRTLLETSGIPDVVLIDTLAVVCWIAWLDLALATVVEVAATLAGRAASRPLIARPWQALVARLVTAVVVAVVVIGSRPQSSPPARSAALAGTLARRLPLRPTDAAAVGQHTVRTAAAPEAKSDSYVVRPGDTLWGIAGQRLGDPPRWPTIWRENADRSEPGGRHFTDPDLIVPGWTLDVRESNGNAARASGTAPTVGQSPPTVSPDAPSPGGSPTMPPPPAPSSTGAPIGAVPPTHNPVVRPGASSQVGPAAVTMPSGGLVGVGFAAGVIAGLATARLHERRRRRVGSGRASAVDALVGPTVRHLHRAVARSRPPEQDDENEDEATPSEAAEEATKSSISAPIAAGITEDGDEVTIIDVVDLTGRSLTGDGADGVGRALVAAAAVEPALDGATLLVIGRARRLLGGAVTIPGVEVIESFPGALTRLLAECERRERVLRWQSASDYRAIASSPDPLASLVVVVDGADVAAVAGRLREMTQRGRRLGISIAVVGEAAGLDPLEVAADGSIVSGGDAPVSERLFTITEAEATELLAVGRAGRGGAVVAAPPEAPTEVRIPDDLPGGGVTSPASVRVSPVDLRLFGPPRILANGVEVTTGLRAAARELLCLLAVHRSGVRQEEALAEMWPDDEDEHLDTFRVAVTSTRRRLRELCGEEGQYVVLMGSRYTLDPGDVACDVWRFDAAVIRASLASEDELRRQALTEAADAVTGEPLAGVPYEWAEPVRENLRRRAIDVLGELGAVLGAEGDLAGAVAALERARAVDPYCEDVYRRLMGHLADMGRDDVALRVYRELEKYVAQLGAAPDEDTEALMETLRTRAAAARPASSSHNGNAPPDDDDDAYGGEEVRLAARRTILGRRAAATDEQIRAHRPVDEDQLPLPIIDVAADDS